MGIVRLNHPTTLNAITIEMIDELTQAIDQMAGSSRCMLLTASGRAFCSGANLSGKGFTAAHAPVDAGTMLERYVNPLMEKLANLRIPWMTAVNGPAVGVGCSLALASDFIVASKSTYFLQAFARVGLVPDGGSSWLLMRGIGRMRASEMMLFGEPVSADTALAWGMVNRVVSDETLHAEALSFARRLANGPTKALGMIRRLAWSAADTNWGQTLWAERCAQGVASQTDDAYEGIRAFLEKRPAKFTGN